MADTIPITFKGDAAQIISTVQAQAAKNGIQFTGDEKSGSFSGQGFEGTYEITGQVVTITVLKKPFFVPLALLKSKLESFAAAV